MLGLDFDRAIITHGYALIVTGSIQQLLSLLHVL